MTDCIIIGGGIIGMLTARNLQIAGYKVRIIEKGETGRESSWAGGGIISPLYPWRYKDSITELATWGQAHYQSLSEQLKQDTDIDPEYTSNGLLIISPDEEAEAVNWAKQFSSRLSIISPNQVSQIEPAMQTQEYSGIWMEAIAQVRNPRLVKALRTDIDHRGIEVISRTEVTSFKLQNQKITGVSTKKGDFEADQFAVCSGAWTGELLKPLGIEIPITPVQGQMILFKAGEKDITRIVLEEDRYIIPRRDGRVLFGSTVEHVDFNKQVTAQAKQELHDIAIERFPILKNMEIEHHWAGLRPGSPDGVPMISQHPEYENLFINAGHFRNGVVLAPASCQLITEIMLDQPTSFASEDYSIH